MKKLLVLFMAILAGVCMTAQMPARFSVVIHEILADPAPQVGLPNSEFVELRNVSGAAISLRNWKISDGSSTATININYILGADSCVVICPTASQAAFSLSGAAIGVSNFPSLNNDADVISL